MPILNYNEHEIGIDTNNNNKTISFEIMTNTDSTAVKQKEKNQFDQSNIDDMIIQKIISNTDKVNVLKMIHKRKLEREKLPQSYSNFKWTPMNQVEYFNIDMTMETMNKILPIHLLNNNERKLLESTLLTSMSIILYLFLIYSFH